MNDWIEQNWFLVGVVLASAAGFLLLVSIVLLLLWQGARRRWNAEREARVALERERIDLELSLGELSGRLRIIRELHEVAVHDMSVIIGQADGARYAGETDPTAAVRATSVISDAARSTLADLRRVMTLVRDGESAIDTQPELKSTRELFKVMREAGLVVDFEETGKHFELKAGAELAVYRILQESLTNALKYGGTGTEVRVVFTWTDEGFQVRIDDDGVRNETRLSGQDPNEIAQQRTYDIDEDLDALTGVATGPGMSEMRERTELFGGVFTATCVPGVGFTISASFPALRYHNGIHGVNLEA